MRRAASISPSAFPPSGGSSCTETTNSRAASSRASSCRLLAGGWQRFVPLLTRPRRRSRRPVLVDRRADRRDLRGRRAAATSDQLRAEAPRAGGELGEVLRRRVRERDPGARERRQTDVRQRCEDGARAGHLGERVERRRRTAAVVRSERREVELAQTFARLARRDPCQRHGVAVEAHQRDEREASTPSGPPRLRARARPGRRRSRA